MSVKMMPCVEGRRHKWLFVENKNCRTESLNSIGWTMRGMCKCATCRLQKYGEPQYNFAARRQESE